MNNSSEMQTTFTSGLCTISTDTSALVLTHCTASQVSVTILSLYLFQVFLCCDSESSSNGPLNTIIAPTPPLLTPSHPSNLTKDLSLSIDLPRF